jgi:AcrR family transcriptional regulator
MDMKQTAASRRAAGARRRRAYDASGRRAEAERTRARVIDVATELVKAGVRPEDISYADLAERAGVATRTVYRQFPETTDLVTAVAAGTLNRLTGGTFAPDRPAIAAQLARFHEILCADPKLFRVLIDTPLRGEMDYAGFLKRVFADVLERIPARHRDATTATIEMLANPYAWEVMHSYWGMPREQITRTCLAAIQAITDRFQREPELLDPKGPLPPMFRNPIKRKETK